MSHQAASWWIFNRGGEFQLQIDWEPRGPILIGQSGTYELEVEAVWIKGCWAFYGSRDIFSHQVQVSIRHPLRVIEQQQQIIWGLLHAHTNSYKRENTCWTSGPGWMSCRLETLWMLHPNPKARDTILPHLGQCVSLGGVGQAQTLQVFGSGCGLASESEALNRPHKDTEWCLLCQGSLSPVNDVSH